MITSLPDTAANRTNKNLVAQKSRSPMFRYSNGPIYRTSIDSSTYPHAESPLPSSSPMLSSSAPFRPTKLRTPLAFTDHHPGAKVELSDLRVDVICNWLHQKQMQRMWSIGEPDEGVMVRKTRNVYSCCPAALADHPHGLYSAVKEMKAKVVRAQKPLGEY